MADEEKFGHAAIIPHGRMPQNGAMTQLIFLPGLASDEAMWQSQLDAVSSTARQASVTDVHARYDCVDAMAAGVLAENPGDLVLCGASMGGIIAMEVARQAPQRVKGLALLGTTARPETDDMRRLRADAITLFESGRMGDVLQANVPLAFAPANASNAALVNAYLEMIGRAGAQQLVRQNRAIMGRPDARAHLGALRCPVLVVCGESDQLTPPECSREIAALVPHSELIMLPQCGHMLTMEDPVAVNALLAGWLFRLG
jgi:pimeloyl-ACP methyl ester carboxylesterase